MIEDLTIQNLQSHKNSHFDFDKGVNVIIGKSDTGKSAAFRALNLLIYNKPSGEAYRSNWGGETLVSSHIDGKLVERKRGKTNEYILEDSSFKAMKTEVPEEIKKVINCNEINIQQQMDAPFLLSSTPGKIAEYFNKVAHLAQIDTSLSYIQSHIRELNQHITYDGEQYTKLALQIKEFAYLPKLEIDIEILESLDAQLKNKNKKIISLQKLINSITQTEENIEELKDKVKDEELVNNVLALIEKKKAKNNQITELGTLIRNIKNKQDKIEETKELLLLEVIVDETLLNINKKREKEKKIEKLDFLLSKIRNTYTLQKASEENENKLEIMYKQIFPEVCPLCGAEKKYQKI